MMLRVKSVDDPTYVVRLDRVFSHEFAFPKLAGRSKCSSADEWSLRRK